MLKELKLIILMYKEFITSIIELKNDENLIHNCNLIEEKVKNNIENVVLTDISSKYKNFTSESTNWIIDKYRELVIQEKTESIINFNLIDYIKNKKK